MLMDRGMNVWYDRDGGYMVPVAYEGAYHIALPFEGRAIERRFRTAQRRGYIKVNNFYNSLGPIRVRIEYAEGGAAAYIVDQDIPPGMLGDISLDPLTEYQVSFEAVNRETYGDILIFKGLNPPG